MPSLALGEEGSLKVGQGKTEEGGGNQLQLSLLMAQE